MGWGSFWNSVTHPIEAIKHAGSSIFHAAEHAVEGGVAFVKHTEEKIVHAIMHSAPVEFVKHTVHKITHAVTVVGNKVASGLHSAVEFVKHGATVVADGVKEVWHGAEKFGGSLNMTASMAKILPYALAGVGGLVAMSMLKRPSGDSYSSQKRQRL